MNLTNPLILMVFITAIVSIIILIALITYLIVRKKKMYTNVEKLLNSFLVNDTCSLNKISNNVYDYVLDLRTVMYYIKIVPHFSANEICVNNKVKWQIKSGAFDDSTKMISGIEGLMNLEIDETKTKIKKIKKLFIIYPSSKIILRYINECEMEFVYPDTDIYGSTIITYNQLLNEDGLIK